MRYLVDTNICIYLIKKRSEKLLGKFLSLDVGSVGISSITVAELEYGAHKSSFPEKNLKALKGFLFPFAVKAFDQRAAAIYGEIRTDLERRGQPIGALDMLIAAHCLSLKTVMVTNNVGEFERVNNLKVENWA